MATLTYTSILTHNPDVEPDDQWKKDLRKQIETNLQDMVDNAKKSLDDQLNEAPVDEAERERLAQEHTATMSSIRRIAAEQFQIALERERQERRWATNVQMAPEWSEALVKEQQSILNNIQKDDSQTEKPPHRTSTSPNEDRAQWGPNPSPKRQREPSHFPSISHRGTDPQTRNQDDPKFVHFARNTSGKGVNGSPSGERPPERWSNQPLVEEPGEMDLSDDEPPPDRHTIRPPERSFERTPAERPVRPGEVIDPSWRPPASSPPKPNPPPEFWKPTISQADDAASSRRNVTRRSSAASIGSIGSTNFRSSIPTQIPERPNDSVDMAGNYERERARTQAVEQEWIPMQKAREKERQGQVRTDFRQSSACEASNLRPEEQIVSRASESLSRAAYTPPSRPISNRQSSQNLRGEEPTFVPTPVPISPPRPADPQSRMHPPSSARPIPKKRSSQALAFDDPQLSSPASAGFTSSSWVPENSGRAYQLPLPATRPIASKPSFSLDDPARHHQTSPTARSRPPPSRSPADSRFEHFPRTPDDDARRPMRPLGSATDVRYDQQDGHFDRRRYQADDSDEEYGDLMEQRMADLDPQARRHAEGPNKWDEEAKRRQAARLRERAAMLEEEAQEERRQKEEERRQKEEETKRREDTERREEELRKKEEEAKRLEEEARRKEEDAIRKEEEAKMKQAEARVKEEEARRKEAAARRKEEETRKKEVEIKKREEEVKRREEELNRREAEAEARRKDMEKQDQRQEEFRKREEEIRRRTDERKRQDSAGSHSESRDRAGSTTYSSASPTTPSPPWTGLNRSGSTATDRSSTSSSRSASSTWSSSTRPSSTSSTQASSAGRPPTTPTTPTGSAKSGPAGSQPPSPAPMSESEWARRQAEQAKKQQEQFRLEQERLERERQAKAGKILSKEDVIQLFETHQRQWAQLYNIDVLHWDSFPWPMLKRPLVPDELTPTAIGAYVLSPHYPGDVSKQLKDRIKEHIKRWHPDRFETKLLPKVIEGEREKVKQGAGLVARCLNDLLTRSNVTTIFS